MNKVIYKPIGTIHSPFKDIKGMPIQPAGAGGIKGTIEMNPDYIEGIQDLDGFSHIILIYHFHLSRDYSLKVKPFLDENLRGVFATRAPLRPNPVGVSVVRLVKVEGAILYIEDVDIVDGAPLLDIKPYVPEFDIHEVEKIGWLFQRTDKAQRIISDERFR